MTSEKTLSESKMISDNLNDYAPVGAEKTKPECALTAKPSTSNTPSRQKPLDHWFATFCSEQQFISK